MQPTNRHPSRGIRIKWHGPIDDPQVAPVHKAMMASLKRSGFEEAEPGFWRPGPYAKVQPLPKRTRKTYTAKRQTCEYRFKGRKRGFGRGWWHAPECKAAATVFEQWNQYCDRHAAKQERRESWACVERLITELTYGLQFGPPVKV